MAELPDLGEYCSYSSCNQLDFLPILCYGCKKTFCKLHHAYEKHSCSHESNLKELPEYKGVKSYKCSLNDCTQTELTPVICEPCGKNFCLQHRHQVDHKCVSYEPPKERMTQTKEHIKNILEKNVSASDHRLKTGKGHKSKATAAKVALMKIKMNALGDKGIPEAERVYVKILLPPNCKEKSKAIFFSKKWSVGKTVDYTADLCKLDNRNNFATAKKLKLFEPDQGNVFEFQDIIEDCIKNGQFFSGSTLAMDYVNNDTNSISDLQSYSVLQ